MISNGCASWSRKLAKALWSDSGRFRANTATLSEMDPEGGIYQLLRCGRTHSFASSSSTARRRYRNNDQGCQEESNSDLSMQEPKLLKARTIQKVASLIICGCVICVAWGVYVFYDIERHQMHLRHGRQALERADVRRALTFAQRAVQDRKDDFDACSLMADVQDALDSSTALTWRLRATQLEPANVLNYLALAKTALKMDNPGVALKALDSAPSGSTARGDWQNLMGKTQFALGRIPEAEASFSEAVRLQPVNPPCWRQSLQARLEPDQPRDSI